MRNKRLKIFLIEQRENTFFFVFNNFVELYFIRNRNDSRERVNNLNYINIRVHYISCYTIVDIELN